jgi:hypothetical protein
MQKLFIVLALIGSSFNCAFAKATIIQSKDFSTVQALTGQLAKKFTSAEILVVFDNDNTLLQMDSDLGSDQWFQWQTNLQETDSAKVAPDFSGLLRVQGLLFTLGTMSPPGGKAQVETALAIRQHFPTIVLTARGCTYEPGKTSSFRDATHRELKRNGYEFESSAIEPKAGFGGAFEPYDAGSIAKLGLTEAEKKQMKVTDKPPRTCYSNGIFMTSGQHKGLMLRTLLQKTGNLNRFKAILAVDDKEKYCVQFEEAFHNKAEVHCVRYGAADGRVSAFDASDKKAVTQGWQNIKKAMAESLPSDWN